ncbi:SDR family oxidoreductase [Sphingomonas sp. CL5.1]|uniref:SDR family NAD(P)-dependent oxidoreductase n=1 Tax=Sphingomonas sp. CL5.1 TaxID=2653203 RepID=UPI001581836B|nr:SDR family oxidoreductase [Sphingomonas sp. CL5.1]QKR98393.1 SDR family oxidoreductase [Sphingomonas sp. CL5.1]
MTAPGSSDRLRGKTVIVTGGTRGIGEAIARGIATAGGQVALCGRDAKAGERIAEEIGAASRYLPLDVGAASGWDGIVPLVERQLGPVTGLVNNAGLGISGNLSRMTDDDVMRMIAVNQLGVWHGMRAAGAAMRANGGGSIVNIGSAAATRAHPGIVAYAGTKAAVVGMSLAAAAELAPHRIRVNVIHPGYFGTRLLDESSRGHGRTMGATATPLGRVAEPEEIVGAAVFLLSDESGFVTGTQIAVDGGLTM